MIRPGTPALQPKPDEEMAQIEPGMQPLPLGKQGLNSSQTVQF